MIATSVSNYAASPDIVILTNTPTIQAVSKPILGVVAANFWTNGAGSADLITVNNKASVITLETSNSLSVGISDPTQTNTGSITLTLNRAASSLASADAGVSVVQLTPQVILSVNVNGSAGKTFHATLNYSNSILPVLSNVFPNGATLLQSTNTLAFTATSAVGIPSNNVVVMLNGVQVTNLIFSGTTNYWSVSGAALQPNIVYTAVITVTDGNGNIATTSKTFDTFSSTGFSWEAEDFDYGGGKFLDGPQTNAYAGLSAITNVDTHQVNFAGTDLYRPNGMDTEVNGDTMRAAYNGTGRSDYSLGYFSPGAWANYTRHYPAGAYNVYARLAAGGGATTCALYQVTGGWSTTNQTTNFLGTFTVPNTAWESYNYIPLKTASGNLATATFNGSTNTLRLARPASATSDCNANFLMLVPVLTVNALWTSTNVLLSFPTQSGFISRVQYKTTLQDAAWNSLTNVPGDSTMKSITDAVPSTTRFYRVVEQ